MINHKTFFQGLKSLKGSRSPAIPLGACFIALGALLKDAGFNLQQSAASSLFTYALPGQLVMAESLLVGASIVNIFIASAANATTRPWFRALVCVSEYATLRARSLSPNAWRPTFTPRRRRSKKRTHERRASTELMTIASASTSAFFSSGQEDGICS